MLTGRAPEALDPSWIQPAALPAPIAAVAAGLRSELLQRWPDVRKAERELAASSADVGVATADLFPRVSLLGFVGLQARDVGDLGASDSLRFQFGPSLRWPVFPGGAIRAQIRTADARAAAAAARYEGVILTALSESETAINRYAASARVAPIGSLPASTPTKPPGDPGPRRATSAHVVALQGLGRRLAGRGSRS